MLMWVMSDRAIPRSYRMMQGFGVHTFRLVNAEGESTLREVPLEARRRHALARLGRGGQDLRAPIPTSTAATCGRRSRPAHIPEWELGVQIFTEERGRALQLRRARRDQDRARGAGAGAAGRPHGAEPQPGQLLRRDRAGRLLHGAHRARASTSPTIRCSPAASTPTSTRSSRGSAGRTSTRSRSTRRSRRSHNNQRDGMHRQAIHRGRVAYEPNSLGGGCPFQAGARGLHVVPASRSRERQGARQAREVRRPLHPGDAVLEQPDRRSSRRTSSRAFRFELTKVQTPAVRERVVVACCATSPRTWRQRLPTGWACRCRRRCRA